MKKALLVRVVILLLTALTLSSCLLVPVDDGYRDEGYRGRDHRDHHERRHEDYDDRR